MVKISKIVNYTNNSLQIKNVMKRITQQGKTKQGKTKQGKTKQGKTKQGNSKSQGQVQDQAQYEDNVQKQLQYQIQSQQETKHNTINSYKINLKNKHFENLERNEAYKHSNEYVIAIPSYNRYITIQQKTLMVLNKHKINPVLITIFVANQEQYNLYINNVPKHLYNNIIIGVLGLKNQRNFINEYYPEGTHIVEMDDDVKQIFQLVIKRKKSSRKSNRKSIKKSTQNPKTVIISKNALKTHKPQITSKTIRPITDLDKFIKLAFYMCHKQGIYLWGVYPIANAYFMTDKITTDLRFIVGPMFGIINRHRKDLQLTINEKENSERTLQHWVIDKGVLRFNNVAIDTEYYKNKGGMQNEGKDRKMEALESVKYLHQLYPTITKISLTKKSGMPEIKLIRKNQ